jgi:uncharacterized protein YndB with AHSA1/START domain
MNIAPRVPVSVTRRFSAGPERVFDAWLDPVKASKFLFATPSGTMVRAETDPQVGGSFTFVDRRDGVDVVHTGKYLTIERPDRLVFTFAVPQFSSESTTVSIDIAPMDLGCVLTLSHDGVFEDYATRTESGWTMILNGLAEALMP